MKPMKSIALTALVLIAMSCSKKEVSTLPEVINKKDSQSLSSQQIEKKRAEIYEEILSRQSMKCEVVKSVSSPKRNSVTYAKVIGNLGNPTPLMGSSPSGMISRKDAVNSQQSFNTEEYNHIQENEFKRVTNDPLSTFSIDVDGASFSNTRRFLSENRKPPIDAVRVEEFINYFHYNYPNPTDDQPFSITTTLNSCPWNEKHKIVQIGLQGKKIDLSRAAPSNLVFLLDVSGSMQDENKLPLLQKSLSLLVQEMRPSDRVAIVVYAGAAGVVLPSTQATERSTIIGAIEQLQAGGSTAGAEGIELAYQIAKENFIPGGNNRVILATDGDFNVGVSSESELIRLIEAKRDQKIFLTVLGFGTGNYSDARMEQLANKGNGNYAYIDNLLEAKKVLVTEMGSTMFTIAKDVKLQVEFNPTKVASYRLIGYENRALNNEDFNDDTKDAGELGAGHTVTALYEIVPVGVEKDTLSTVDPLKYQTGSQKVQSDEILTVKFRYKAPEGDQSKLISKVLTSNMRGAETDNWATSMAGFAMLLRESKFAGDLTWNKVLAMARASKGADEQGYRAEAIRMIEQAQLLSK